MVNAGIEDLSAVQDFLEHKDRLPLPRTEDEEMDANRLIRVGMMRRTHDLLMKAHPLPGRGGHDMNPEPVLYPGRAVWRM